MNRQNFTTPVTLASFPLTTISSNNFRWLHAEGWEKYHLDFYSDRKSRHQEAILTPPKRLSKANKHASVPHFGAWILDAPMDKNTPSTLVAWAELHAFKSSFFFAMLLLDYETELIRSSTFDFDASLSELFSSIIISGELGFLQVVDMSDGAAAKMPCLAPFPSKKILTPLKDCSPQCSTPIAGLNLVTIETTEWWQTENGKADWEKLEYLRKRTKARSSSTRQKNGGRSRRMGFIQRLFSPRGR